MSKKPLYSRLDTFFATLETATDPSPVGLEENRINWGWETDGQGFYTRCDDIVTSLLGISSDNFINKPLFSFGLSPDSARKINHALSEDHFPMEVEVVFSTSIKGNISVRMTILKQLTDGGELKGFHGFCQILQPRETIQPVSTKSTTNRQTRKPSLPVHIRPIVDSEQKTKQKHDEISFFDKTVTSPILSIPLHLGTEQAMIEIKDPKQKHKWTEDDRLLAQEVARQLSQAMENARLYQEIRAALEALERRERYQSNIARSVAILSERGTEALPDVLESLGKAAGCGRVVFMEKENREKTYWKPIAAWTNPDLTIQIMQMGSEPIACAFDHWEADLDEKGWAFNTQWDAPSQRFHSRTWRR